MSGNWHEANQPLRELGYYWVLSKNDSPPPGVWIPMQYLEFGSEDLEEEFFTANPDADSSVPVVSYGWCSPGPDQEGYQIYDDSAFTQIGDRLNRPVGA